MPALAVTQPGRTLLVIDRLRSTFAVQHVNGTPAVVVTADITRIDSADLIEEADSEFGICLLVRLTGTAPSIGLLRRSGDGFREIWRTLPPASRPMLRSLQADVERGVPVPVIWRTADGFLRFQLGGWNREHRLWYARLDSVDEAMEPVVIAFSDELDRRLTPSDFIAT